MAANSKSSRKRWVYPDRVPETQVLDRFTDECALLGKVILSGTRNTRHDARVSVRDERVGDDQSSSLCGEMPVLLAMSR